MKERLQKLISAAGLTSRRKAEEWLLAGRVTVNGQVAALGDQADPDVDRVEVDGRPLTRGTPRTYVMLNKPRGYVTTLSDEKGRRTVAQLVSGCGKRLWPVGRLDLDSEGLLLMTDDGELTNRLLHPRHQVEKEYLVWVRGDVDRALPSSPDHGAGRRAPGPGQGVCGPPDRGYGAAHGLIYQGKNRQIRRMCAQAGLEVTRLKRIREGGLRLDRSLKPGAWRPLTKEELALLEESGAF